MSGTAGTRTRHHATEVAVVGAGPTGLLLAGDLAAAGHRVTLVERRAPGLSPLTRAFGVHARTLELLDARGIADDLVDTGAPLGEVRLFGGVTVRLARPDSRFGFLLVTPQFQVEALLARRARAAGVRCMPSTEVSGLAQDGSGVTLHLRRAPGADPANTPAVRTVRAQYVVGTDGHRSTIRRALGQPFPGVSVLRSMVVADVRLLEDPGENALTVRGVRGAVAFLAPFGDGYHRVFAWSAEEREPGSPVELADVRDTVWRAHGTDYGMYDARWLSRFHCDERQVPQYRIGRVFLAGDAAHIHSPAGGQGMNTGLQDAANLSWKLAAALDGVPGAEALLDSYHDERHPVGAAVVRSSGTILRLATAESAADLARLTVATGLLGGLPPLRRRIAGRLSGLDIRYPAPQGAHRLVGRRAVDVPLRGGGRLYASLRAGRHVLVTPDSVAAPAGTGVGVGVGGAVHEHWADPGRRDQWLVRPDGYLAWAADDAAARPPLTPAAELIA
ncbi:FAD-dependent monooxygenase [Streptomyces bohaiensis]|uniref:NAD-binding protein n=1 Tax=Streptomyces bohaiensis TaxID=1431344 RepID=A0ABX1C935_9ACTN|nr:FAD-dependent monooxygenase [Streptomyces bohaiensis]NJQ15661.1 NAD-binding protein [Streptomyces bohaiensis]